MSSVVEPEPQGAGTFGGAGAGMLKFLLRLPVKLK
jgi:hypothetical protein